MLTPFRENKADFLSEYVAEQLAVCFPDDFDAKATIAEFMDSALTRAETCLSSVITFRDALLSPRMTLSSIE